jgi:hypothetical protein
LSPFKSSVLVAWQSTVVKFSYLRVHEDMDVRAGAA